MSLEDARKRVEERARLAAEGWFGAQRKRPLPAIPRAVGIVTSPRAGVVSRIAISAVQQVEGGDLLVVVSTGESAAE